MKRTFKEKTIGSRKGIIAIVLLLMLIAEIVCMLTKVIPITLYSNILVAITGILLFIDIGLISFEKIRGNFNIEAKYGNSK